MTRIPNRHFTYHVFRLLATCLFIQPAVAMIRRVQFVESVDVLVLTESLCPGCKEFIQKSLVPTFHLLGPSVINLTMIPYGNAMITNASKQEVLCQHGLRECDANVWELCAIHKYPDPEQYLPYLECLTYKLPPTPQNETACPCSFKHCAMENHLWWPALETCHEHQAWEMLQKADQATPDHEFVPWIVVDGKQIAPETDLLAEICQAYTAKGGSNKACAKHIEAKATNRASAVSSNVKHSPVSFNSAKS